MSAATSGKLRADGLMLRKWVGREVPDEERAVCRAFVVLRTLAAKQELLRATRFNVLALAQLCPGWSRAQQPRIPPGSTGLERAMRRGLL